VVMPPLISLLMPTYLSGFAIANFFHFIVVNISA
jgi:hypothetical protein